MKQLINTAHQLYKELELWQGMMSNAYELLLIVREGKQFCSDDVLSVSKQYYECRLNTLRVQESIDKVINEIKAL